MCRLGHLPGCNADLFFHQPGWITFNDDIFEGGATEEEAVRNLAIAKGWKLWNEEK